MEKGEVRISVSDADAMRWASVEKETRPSDAGSERKKNLGRREYVDKGNAEMFSQQVTASLKGYLGADFRGCCPSSLSSLCKRLFKRAPKASNCLGKSSRAL